MVWGAVGQAAAAGGLGFGGPAFQWGLANKSTNRYKSAVRHLRRREYQDMVFSMRKAGLNPMLASGATPGHSAMVAAQPGSVDAAGAVDKVASAWDTHEQRPGKIQKTIAEKVAAEEAAGVSSARAATEREMPALVRRQIADKDADIELKGKQAELTEAQKLVQLKQEGLLGMNAKEVEERLEGIRLENVRRKAEADVFSGEEGKTIVRAQEWGKAAEGAVGTARNLLFGPTGRGKR